MTTNKTLTMSNLLARSKPTDWRPLDPENTLYVELAAGRVVIELAPAFAPNHVANVKALAREHYYDGLAIVRCQDNYVVQWGDPEAEKPESTQGVAARRVRTRRGRRAPRQPACAPLRIRRPRGPPGRMCEAPKRLDPRS